MTNAVKLANVHTRSDVTLLAASEVVGSGTSFRPSRVVLYRNPLKVSQIEYVVHTERLEPAATPGFLRHQGFDDGFYTVDLGKAYRRFEERAARL